MRKEMYVYRDGVPERIVIRSYGERDFSALIDIQRVSFPPPFPEELWWNEEQLSEHVERFPEGALCAEAEDGRLIGSMTGLIVRLDDYGHAHDWQTITDGGYIRNHRPDGDTLYVVDICVIPEYRKAGIGKWLMQSMYETVVHLGLKRLLGGGRMPGYHKYADVATPAEYVDNVVKGVWKDPVISFLLRCGRIPVGIAEHYLDDEESLHHAVLMEWKNPFQS
ncbi:GNAT family N-acetyltransferase [Paenibacillus cisolokensis]|jgi:ribosomal protein S18 acetylase RimI-like enzyme|uniref:N-acetyltransferase YkwB n=1 Tax=Paenibacillus cisolokensis TaxID=1658519 RepID=A0ABQ4N4X3_9BACL|nr:MULTISPECIES: GNAT family N-acetyltransferase [Paenibacillus]ALS27965.1 acetyltransferase [Paenibacillus sp. 32O-W]GIQ63249.1 putative N-acetyltransferase YkwB [Paenibacillus cisolokensis]